MYFLDNLNFAVGFHPGKVTVTYQIKAEERTKQLRTDSNNDAVFSPQDN